MTHNGQLSATPTNDSKYGCQRMPVSHCHPSVNQRINSLPLTLGTAPKQMWKSKECLWGSFPPQNIHSLLGLFVGVEGSHVFGCPHLFRFLPGGSISVAIKYGKVSTPRLSLDKCGQPFDRSLVTPTDTPVDGCPHLSSVIVAPVRGHKLVPIDTPTHESTVRPRSSIISSKLR